MARSPLLLEIGVEELPSSFVDAALGALPAIGAEKVAEVRLLHGEVKALGTPRRLAIYIPDLAETQLDLDERVVGPPESAAFKNGQPTKAAEAFAQKLGVGLDQVTIQELQAEGRQKAGRYLIGRRVEKGRHATELLGKVLTDICAAIPFRKSMRWGDGDVAFGRPIQWLVALFGSKVIDFSYAGVRSGAITRGHRFLAPDTFTLSNATGYVDELRKRHVLVDRSERESTMMSRVADAAKSLGGAHDREPMLVSENASLVEEPHVLVGTFDREFLGLPPAVIRAVARGHQRYFCVEKNEDELLPNYLFVANTANDPKMIAKGNDRVMRARLADAQFFFEEDKKVASEQRIEKLGGIVFHHRLGTVREKVSRIERLTGVLCDMIGLGANDKADALRAAHLAKFDLVSLMVGEFPELQGQMGRAYALFQGENARVASAIRDHYRPAGATDEVPTDEIASIVALADRVDTLVSCFAVGLIPTGAADPFALRRNCIGALRILLDVGERNPAFAKVPLGQVFFEAYAGFADKKLDLGREETVAKLLDFATERLRGLVGTITSNAVADAIIAGTGAASANSPVYTLVRARAVQSVVDHKEPWLDKAKIVAKRLSGISKEAKSHFHPLDAFKGSAKDDAALVRLIQHAHEQTHELVDTDKVKRALASTETIATKLDELFVTMLINDPNDPFTPKRLELLSYGAQCMLRLADFSKLS